MPQIQIDQQLITQITIIEAEPEKQTEALSLMRKRAQSMQRQPGFISQSTPSKPVAVTEYSPFFISPPPHARAVVQETAA